MLAREDKKKIRDLRLQGLGFKRISDKLGLKLAAVRGYCRRHGMGGFFWELVNPPEEPTYKCPCCGKTFVQQETGRKRRYCSNACKQRAYRERINSIQPDKGGGYKS